MQQHGNGGGDTEEPQVSCRRAGTSLGGCAGEPLLACGCAGPLKAVMPVSTALHEAMLVSCC